MRRPHPVWQILALMLAAAACGTVAQSVRKTPLPWFTAWSRQAESAAQQHGLRTVGLQEARRIVDGLTHIVLDARKQADYAAGHLPGALSVPSDNIPAAIGGVMPLLAPGQPVMVYCSGQACDESIALALYLQQNRMTNVVVYAGGFSEWSAAKQKVER